MRDLALIEQSFLSLPKDASFERRIELRGAVDFAKQLLRELERMSDDSIAEYLNEHGDQEYGGMLWTFSRTKKITPKLDPEPMTERCFELVGGDLRKFCGLLSANAYKQGAVRSACKEAGTPEVFDTLFQTEIEKTPEGKPVKSVKKIPANFVK